ncbi:hypothetical protein IV51_GL000494 [Fructilactobacillus fructivorans]|nr:hypothetical protein FC73_GL001038 [Fructilactobacillus fructivorans]KRN39912.1 hypothetical protein IV51_GL000494 [Fructilactobacillus fructivorans]
MRPRLYKKLAHVWVKKVRLRNVWTIYLKIFINGGKKGPKLINQNNFSICPSL